MGFNSAFKGLSELQGKFLSVFPYKTFKLWYHSAVSGPVLMLDIHLEKYYRLEY